MSDASHLNLEFVKILEKLKPTYKIAMITDADTALIAPFLDNHHVRELFDIVITSSDVKCTKPQKQIFEILIHELGVVPSEIAFIDNSAKNTDAAAALGMSTILHTTNEHLQEQLHSLAPSLATS